MRGHGRLMHVEVRPEPAPRGPGQVLQWYWHRHVHEWIPGKTNACSIVYEWISGIDKRMFYSI